MRKWANELNRAFSREEVQMAKKTHEEMLKIPVHKGNEIKTRLRFYLTPVEMVIIQYTNNTKCWQGCGEKGTLILCWRGCKLAQLWEVYGGST
jgi:hypothetical protein